ncbi:putative sigma-adaptin 3, putative,adaptor complex AP-3 small subunit [Trypanosoma theileri]|uniref:Putative sigma-adaptin 3, putative,adaptor complex AP-3 small subunit n=1 Tax=Trypanosoma theileri TaxID=67003 RepID=A0A1X0P4S6_9TRYP|nr:putative sigma-adaptin 3, putative,adaptor complex AP-3 small subunit [Trypanosoma theileri]ORC91838.1 putative sigma-adaptin 3, putative,adaptor complex AP-3 small subunit [Trypanosoma theileri]
MTSSARVTATLWDGLPLTVEELALRYRRILRINKNLSACIDSFRVECDKLASSSPYAAQALRDILPVISEVGSSNSCNPTTSVDTATATATATAVVVRDGKMSRSQSGVLEGVVVKQGKVQHTSSHSVVVDNAKSRILRFVEDTTRDYKEEYNVLRLKLMEMESSQQLLATALRDVEDQKKRCARYASSLDVCREELAKSRSQCQFLLNILSDGYYNNNNNNNSKNKNKNSNDNNCTEEDEVERFIEDIRLNLEKVDEISKIKGIQEPLGDEGASRLSLGIRVVQTEVALQESQAAVNSLNASVEQLSYDNDHLKARLEALTAERDTLKIQCTQLEGQVQRVLTLLHEDHNSQYDDDNVVRQRKGIDKCQDMTSSRVEMVEQLQKLQEENRSLQQSVQQYKRQINDAELRAEEMAAEEHKKDEEIHALEEEIIHLRKAVHEKQLKLQQTCNSWKSAAADWGQLDKVHRTVIEHISRRLVLYTGKDLLAAHGSDDLITEVPEKHLSPSGAIKLVKEIKKEEVQKLSETETTTIEEVPVNLSSENERVKELLERIESMESEHRSLMKHWQKANHELRSALASSQEELRKKDNRIRVLEQRQELNMMNVATCESQYDTEYQSKGYDNTKKNTTISSNSTHGVSITQDYSVNQILPEDCRLLQVENESLHRQIFDLKEKYSSLNLLVDNYRKRCETLEREIEHNAKTMTQLVICGFTSPTPTGVRSSSTSARSSTDVIQIRNLQSMLQCVLQEKMELLTKLRELEAS